MGIWWMSNRALSNAHPLQWVDLLRRNLRFHRRGNFAVILGIAVGTAALVGALLIGDSLRGSLRERVTRQIGSVDQVLIAPGYFNWTRNDCHFYPLLVLAGSLESPAVSAAPIRRVPGVAMICDEWMKMPTFVWGYEKPSE